MQLDDVGDGPKVIAECPSHSVMEPPEPLLNVSFNQQVLPGADIVEKFNRKHDFDLIVRAHQVLSKGDIFSKFML